MADLTLLLERLMYLLRSEQRDAGAQQGLQPVHFSSLLYLSQANRYSDTPAGATEFLGATKGTISQSLLLLERRGLIEKTPDEKDGRVTHMRLTAEGRKALMNGWPSRAVRAGLEELTETDRERLGNALLGFLAGLQRANGARSFGVCRTCRLFEQTGRGSRCGLTGERLTAAQTEKICREHELATEAPR